MSPLIIIPARLESKRLPGKMLWRIHGRTLIEWTWRAACRAPFPGLIATDSDEIWAEAREFGARVVRTGPCANGTERCATVLEQIGDRPDIVVNWQGDSPLTPAWIAGALVRALEDETAAVTTPVRLVDRLEPGQSVAVLAENGKALYFSRQPVPTGGPWWAHVGLYAYRAKALGRYGRKATGLEHAEGLEQLRWLGIGEAVHCVPVEVGPIPEVNVAGDIDLVARELGVEA